MLKLQQCEEECTGNVNSSPASSEHGVARLDGEAERITQEEDSRGHVSLEAHDQELEGETPFDARIDELPPVDGVVEPLEVPEPAIDDCSRWTATSATMIRSTAARSEEEPRRAESQNPAWLVRHTSSSACFVAPYTA